MTRRPPISTRTDTLFPYTTLVRSLYHQGRVMPFWGGGIADARRLRSNELMYYRLMGHGRARGMRVFDFGRSRTGSGQAAWKRSFGFDPAPLSYHGWSATGERRDVRSEERRAGEACVSTCRYGWSPLH